MIHKISEEGNDVDNPSNPPPPVGGESKQPTKEPAQRDV